MLFSDLISGMKIDRNDGLTGGAAGRKVPPPQSRSQYVRHSMQSKDVNGPEQHEARPRYPKRLPSDIRAAKMYT